MWYSTSLVTVEMHLETGLHFGPSWIRRIWRSFLVRWISNFGTVNFGTPQHSRNHSNHSFNRLTIVSKVVITFRISKNHVSIIGTVKGQSVLYFRTRALLRNTWPFTKLTFNAYFFWKVSMAHSRLHRCWWRMLVTVFAVFVTNILS